MPLINKLLLKIVSHLIQGVQIIFKMGRYVSTFCVECLVSKSRYRSYESKLNLKTPNIAPQPERQPEFPGDADDDGDGAPTTLQSGQSPNA